MSHIELDSKGFAGLEMKTGTVNRSLQRNQAKNYLAATEGNAVSRGQKAKQAGLGGGAVPTRMYLIEPK